MWLCRQMSSLGLLNTYDDILNDPGDFQDMSYLSPKVARHTQLSSISLVVKSNRIDKRSEDNVTQRCFDEGKLPDLDFAIGISINIEINGPHLCLRPFPVSVQTSSSRSRITLWACRESEHQCSTSHSSRRHKYVEPSALRVTLWASGSGRQYMLCVPLVFCRIVMICGAKGSTCRIQNPDISAR